VWPRVGALRTIEIGEPGEQRERLNGYVLHGAKRATAGLLMTDYVAEGEPLESVGERLVLLDSAGTPVGLIEVTGVEVVPFALVTDAFAVAEGEGFAGWDDWAVVHRRHWTRSGVAVDDGTEVVCLWFDLVRPAPADRPPAPGP
jgi:uncharacterized protein YhfF